MTLTLTRTPESLAAAFDRADAHRVVEVWTEALIALFCTAAGVAREQARRTHATLGTELDPTHEEVWQTSSGATLRLRGEAIYSGHGVHGVSLQIVATGLPAGVQLGGSWWVDHRRGGGIAIRVVGCSGLAALAATLATASAAR